MFQASSDGIPPPAVSGFPPAPPAFVPPMMPAAPFIPPPGPPGIMPPQFSIPPPGFGFPLAGPPEAGVIGKSSLQ